MIRNIACRFTTRFLTDQSGATAIEYGLIAALVGVAIIVGAGFLGQSLNTTFNNLATELSNNQP